MRRKPTTPLASKLSLPPVRAVFGPGRSDPKCRVCRGTGRQIVGQGGRWTLCECRERSYRQPPENPTPHRDDAGDADE